MINELQKSEVRQKICHSCADRQLDDMFSYRKIFYPGQYILNQSFSFKNTDISFGFGLYKFINNYIQQFSDIKENIENLQNFSQNELYMTINKSIIEEQENINKIQEEYDQVIEDISELEIEINYKKAEKSDIENLIDKTRVELYLVEDKALLKEYENKQNNIENNLKMFEKMLNDKIEIRKKF